jgi:hypothetical protein
MDYTPVYEDVGRSVRVVVTATNNDGAVEAASLPSALVEGLAIKPSVRAEGGRDGSGAS